MASLFTKIINGEIPAYKVYEDDEFIAFLDIFPIAKGHTLVVPKEEIDNVFDIEDGRYQRFHLVCKKIAHALAKTIPCERVGSAIVGLEIPHAHIHLVPLNEIADLNFEKKKLKFSEQEFTEIAEAIQKAIQ